MWWEDLGLLCEPQLFCTAKGRALQNILLNPQIFGNFYLPAEDMYFACLLYSQRPGLDNFGLPRPHLQINASALQGLLRKGYLDLYSIELDADEVVDRHLWGEYSIEGEVYHLLGKG